MALEEARPVMFRVVLCLVPGLFYVKYLERKNVPRFQVSSRAHIRGLVPGQPCLMTRTGGRGTRRTRGTASVFNGL
jgi:hypothetical protein